MAPTLYMLWPSPPARAVLMTAKSLNLALDLKEVDTTKGENKTPEFIKINPQHTVPTLVDEDGFVLWDSHAIMTYLVSKYSKDDSLYPKDLKKRALVDQRLHFDNGVAFALTLKILRPIIYHGVKKGVGQEEKDAIEEVYAFVEAFLEGRQWIAGDSVTVADYSLISTITTLNVLVKVDASKYSRVAAWLQRAETLPEYELNKKGLDLFINPQHTVPTLVEDDGFVLWDSHAIMSYLVSKSSKDDSLYPKDLKKRALVDQRLHFDSGVAFALALKILRPIVYDGKKTVEQEEKDAIEEVYAFVETFLEGRRWIAGDSVTIADYSLISTITSLNVLSKVDAAKYSRVAAWLQRAETLPEYEANKKGLDLFAALMKSILG
ncbi:unnamed protein product [Tenebrio molitor]|nr:unnamed protein product [Tenebrio molitor]